MAKSKSEAYREETQACEGGRAQDRQIQKRQS